MADRWTGLLNVGLRSLTLGIRFLFIFFLARYLDPASLGYYGLFTATVGYCLYFVGLDFYVYVTREILKAPEGIRGQLLKAQAALSGLLILAVFLIAVLLLPRAGWPGHLVWWFMPILLFEYLNQEIYRLLIVLSKQITASLLLFMRQGSWALAIIALMAGIPESRDIDTVMALWCAAGGMTAALGIWTIVRLRFGGWHMSVDWGWVKRGINISLAFLVATVALRGIQTIDRYWLEALGGIETVGAYVLFFGMASALMTFLDAGVFAFGYPALIRHHHAGEHDEARALSRRMLAQTIAVSSGFAVISWLVLPYLLDWIGNPIYRDRIYFYPWLLLAMVLNALGMVPHYTLYAKGHDRPIIYSHLAALAAFVLFTLALAPKMAEFAVPIALNAAFALVLIWKSIAYLLLGRAGRNATPKSS